MLWQYCQNNLNRLLIGEIKIDTLFPETKFYISGYIPFSYWLDRSKIGGDFLLYVMEDILSNIVYALNSNEIEAVDIKINLWNEKWLLGCSYNTQKSLIENYLSILGRSMDSFSSNYDHFILMGDLNSGHMEPSWTVSLNY